MLFLVGTGVSYNDISMRAVEACKGCELYIERYTSLVDERKIEYLEGLLGKKVNVLSREDLEDLVKEMVAKAKGNDIAILVGGDPLTATTHKILLIEAKRQGVAAKILHSSSAIPAVMGESGLDFYRFGQVCTIPGWTDSYKPVSFYETIERNLSGNLHSLVLLDYYPEKGTTLSVQEAIKELEAAESSYKKGIIAKGTRIMVVHDIGTDKQRVAMTTIGAANGVQEGQMATIIIPAKLSEIEKETVNSILGV